MKTNWVRCADELPEEKHFVLIWCSDIKCKFTAYLQDNAWKDARTGVTINTLCDSISHWSVLPDEPNN